MMRSPHRSRVDHARWNGFTLVETVFALVIVGVMVAMAAPHIDFERARVDSDAMQVSSQLLLAQRLAVLRQHDIRVSFADAPPALLVHFDANNDGLVASTETVRTEALGEGVRFGVNGAVLFGTGTPVTFAANAAGVPTVVFHRNGSASQEGAVHITSTSPNGSQKDRAVRVTRATGLARCWTRISGAWAEGC